MKRFIKYNLIIILSLIFVAYMCHRISVSDLTERDKFIMSCLCVLFHIDTMKRSCTILP